MNETIVYKVIYKDDNKYFSCILYGYDYLRFYAIQYYINKWISNKCFAFETVEQAKCFIDTLCSPKHRYKIFKAITHKTVIVPNIRWVVDLTPGLLNKIRQLSTQRFIKYVSKFSGTAPSGTLLCTGLKLIEEIPYV